jgi:hypothetical protein
VMVLQIELLSNLSLNYGMCLTECVSHLDLQFYHTSQLVANVHSRTGSGISSSRVLCIESALPG